MSFFSRTRTYSPTPDRSRYGLGLLKALREVALIVLSIFLAFQLENWKENQKERKKEIIVLEQLHKALQEDSADYAGNIVGYRTNIAYLSALLNEITASSPKSGFGPATFPGIGKQPDVSNQPGAVRKYQKSNGFDIISNDTLRVQIIQLYENTYDYWIKSIETRWMQDYQREVMGPILLEYLPVGKYFQDYTKDELEFIVEHFKERSVWRKIALFRDSQTLILGNYLANRPVQLRLLRNIRQEVARLKQEV